MNANAKIANQIVIVVFTARSSTMRKNNVYPTIKGTYMKNVILEVNLNQRQPLSYRFLFMGKNIKNMEGLNMLITLNRTLH